MMYSKRRDRDKMNTMRYDQCMKKDQTKKLFLSLINGLGEIYEGGMNSYRGYSNLPKVEREYMNERREYLRLKQLERRKKIKLKKEGGRFLYEFTEDGFIYALKVRIITCETKLDEGEVCMVVFDIPEDIKKVRSVFRRLLKQSNFYMIQKSVWETNMEVVEDLRLLVKLLKVEKYIRVYRALEVR